MRKPMVDKSFILKQLKM